MTESANPPVLNRAAGGTPYRVARLFSNLFSPPIIALFTFWVMCNLYAPAARWTVFLICVVTQSIIPIIYLRWAVHRGWIGDMDMSNRGERRWGLPLLSAIYLTGSLVAFALGVPTEILAVCFFTLGVLGVIWASNLLYKASGHVAGVSAYMVVLSLFGSVTIHPGYLVIPIIAWARVRTGAHTVAQTFWGFVIGAGLTWIMWVTVYQPFVAR